MVESTAVEGHHEPTSEDSIMRKSTKQTVAVALLAGVVAAAPLAASAADTMDKAADKAKTVTGEAKTAVTDSWVTSKTKIALFADDRVKGSQVHVETVDGVVNLRGKVDSPEAKAAATSIAQGIEGAKSVKNNLQVVAPGNRKAVDAKDVDIAKAVESKLSRETDLKKVDVRADAGVVTLKGEVPTIMASARASEMAREVDGVRSVKNQLTFTQ
jgi:hyperosmotically inducible periplasmic protein